MKESSDNIMSTQNFGLKNEKAFECAFREYFPALCYFARRFLNHEYDPEDLVMDCFTKLWEKQINFRSSESIKSFLYTTVRNACIDLTRKKKISVISIEAKMDNQLHMETEFIDSLIEAEVISELHAAAEFLPKQIKRVFKLFFIEGKNEREISKELNTSYNTVRNQRHRAVVLLKGKLQ